MTSLFFCDIIVLSNLKLNNKRRCPTLSEKNIQQEIAPLKFSEEESLPQPVKKKKWAAVFFDLTPTQTITYMAVLVAVAVVLKMFSLSLGTTKISFLYLPAFLAGALMGPLAGFVVGGLGDAIGSSIQFGSPNLIILAGNALMGAIVGFVFMIFRKNKPYVNIIIGAVFALIICSLIINTIGSGLYSAALGNALILDDGKFTVVSWWRTLVLPMSSPIPRIALQPIMVAINTALCIPCYYAIKRSVRKKW